MQVSIRTVLSVVGRYRGVSVDALTGPDRSHPIVVYRFEACLLAKEFTGMSLPEIGRRMGGRDHTTIINAVRQAAQRASICPDHHAELEDMRSLIAAEVNAPRMVHIRPPRTISAIEVARRIQSGDQAGGVIVDPDEVRAMARLICRLSPQNTDQKEASNG